MSLPDMMVISRGVLVIVNMEENGVVTVIVLGGLKWILTVELEVIIGSAFRSENNPYTFRSIPIHHLLFHYILEINVIISPYSILIAVSLNLT